MLRVDAGDCTVLISLEGGVGRCAYWGPRLPSGSEAGLATLDTRPTPHGMLDCGETLDLFPEQGRGFSGAPALAWRRDDGRFISQLTCEGCRHVGDGWELRLRDERAEIEVLLTIAPHPSGVVGIRSSVRNLGDTALHLDWVAACALPLPHDEILAYDGRWAGEWRPERTRLPTGQFAKENRTGRTSHHAPPFLVVGEPGFGEANGRVLGLHLAWSGDTRLFVERLRDGRLQVQAGELLAPGEVALAAGESYRSPWLYAAWSDRGLGGLSDRFHAFVRRHVLDGRLKRKRRPVHYNTWEAVYFQHDLATLMTLAEHAAAVGAERFVLDDGWFRNRGDDTAGLGDWTPDPGKYPDGLGPLVAHVRKLRMEFGLWVEPEMANADSDLLRAHPDWILGSEGRAQPLGRGQYVLDLSRREVSDHVFGQIDRLLRENAIAYLKWDMNRDLSHPESGGRPASRAHTLAVYALIDRIRAAHPSVEIESCASGGGRADYEILRRTDRIWTSDCNDPVERQRIQQGFSIFFPPEVMGAHVGPAASHTTARTSSVELRGFTALFGHMGIEADLRELSNAERHELASIVELHKRYRGLLHTGRTLRLTRHGEGATAMIVTNGDEALVSYAQLETPPYATLEPLRLAGIGWEETYEVQLLNPPRVPKRTMKAWPALFDGEAWRVSGAALTALGLPLPLLRAGEIAVFSVNRTWGEG